MGGSLDFHLGLAPSRFDAMAQRVREHGTPAGTTVQQSDEGSTFLEVVDPDGNSLKVMRIEPQS